MKKILCYGDSNTWGYISGSKNERYDENTRFTKLLQKILGNDFEIIEEGLPGRTCGADDIKEYFGNVNGSLYFSQCVYTHSPLDFVVILLGTNDLKSKFDRMAKNCADDLENLYIKPLKNCFGDKITKVPQIIIVAPAKISDGCYGKFENANIKSRDFYKEYKDISEKNNCYFVDNTGLENGIDCVHLTAKSHKLLAEKIANLISDY